ncbi:MAG: phosphoribosyltransferase [Rhodocyclaceae bacterium]|nr:phosphoribosyltransferase [Rhodocyclaceae bacterium]
MTQNLPARIERITWARFDRLTRALAQKILASGFRPEAIVAIARGGLAPARVLADELELAAVSTLRIAHYWQAEKLFRARIIDPLVTAVEGRRILLVDDVADTGETFAAALRHLSEKKPAEVKTAVVLYKTTSSFRPDYYAMRIKRWRWTLFPWAINEDVGGFLRAMKPPPTSLEEVARRLHERGLRLTPRLLTRLVVRHLPALETVATRRDP